MWLSVVENVFLWQKVSLKIRKITFTKDKGPILKEWGRSTKETYLQRMKVCPWADEGT